MTKIRVDLGITMNTGNFQSARIDMGIEDDVRDGETVDDAITRVYSKVESRINGKIEEMQKELESND
jgi:hypothetical protein